MIFSDPHIEEQNIQELDNIFAEIISYDDNSEYNICLGDWYHNKRPTPKELEFGTRWAKYFNEKRDFILLKGNHPEINEEISSIDYLRYLGIEITDTYINNNIYFAHKSTEKSEMRCSSNVPYFKKFEISIKELEEYDLVILGHQHNYQHIANNIYHLGSCINTTFNEIGQKKYIVRIINNTRESARTLDFIELKSVIPMVEVFNLEDLSSIPQRTKVRLTINNFEDFKKWINYFDVWKEYFYVFKIKLNFVFQDSKIKIIKKSFKEMIDEWLNNIESEEVKNELKNEFEKIEEGGENV